MIEPTDEMRIAFRVARAETRRAAEIEWCHEHRLARCPRHITPDRLDDAGVAAVLAIVERDQALATEYTLSALPEEHDLASHFQIKVTYRGRGKWAVIWRSYCLGRDGKWDWESLPSNRTDEWLAGHRFELDEALRLARLKLPQIDIRGRTAADFLNDQDGRS